MANYWLMKSEPNELSIYDLEKLHTVEWFGIRNYQARNFMIKGMQIGDLAFFWHSSCKNPGIYGIIEICTTAHPDSTQFIANHKYYDPKSTINKPIWFCVDVKFKSISNYISIEKLRTIPKLSEMQVLKKGNRLSITKVSQEEWQIINNLIVT